MRITAIASRLFTCAVLVAAAAMTSAPTAAAQPTAPQDFVSLADVDPTILQEIRYFTPHNFTGDPVDGYLAPMCILTRSAAEALRRVPGVFLDDRYEHSLRAYAFEGGRTVPLPTTVMHAVLAQLRLTRVSVHSTFLDTALVAREVDKGKGLLALLELAEQPHLETVAIGDSEPDLPMFEVAARSCAPRHIGGRAVAQLLGCRVARRSYQPGLLEAVRFILHPDGRGCPRCQAGATPVAEGLLWDLLRAADRPAVASTLRALLDPMAWRTFEQS